ncbi:MAG: peptidoglycan DD-metalloendopeptidase family protein [Candidatus Rokubacteria bacterium]|nr:peptidoglycan DD-metalloendopeptidase family protein [Candidatus Rokubacteria bacterium]
MHLVPRSGWKTWLLVTLILSLLIVGVISYLGWRQSVPGVRAALVPPPNFIGLRTPLTLTLTAARGGLAWTELRLVQGTQKVTMAQQTFPPPLANEQRLALTVEGRALGLREGTATLEVYARDGFWRPLRVDDRPILRQPITLDLTPPTLELLSATRYLAQGGGGLVVYRAKGANRTGVNVGGIFFPGFPVGPSDAGTHAAMVAVPHDFPLASPVVLTAQDEAGNNATRAVASEIKPRKFPTDTVDIKEEFLQKKLPELLPERGSVPAGQLLQAFLTVNRDKRRQAEETKRTLSARTQPKPLWQGFFLQPKNTKVSANYAETRSYRFRGQDVDTQVHFGYDLASVRESPVPAANRGTVVFAGPLTIYGNTVLLDHGLGLQTLYAHLSRIDVKEGQEVEKGAELGRTGTSGLATGDHLHYEVLIHGVSVTPLERWDARWIRDHILKPLREANVALIDEGDSRDEPATPPPPRQRRSPAPR